MDHMRCKNPQKQHDLNDNPPFAAGVALALWLFDAISVRLARLVVRGMILQDKSSRSHDYRR
jgi:hypothetical protein